MFRPTNNSFVVKVNYVFWNISALRLKIYSLLAVSNALLFRIVKLLASINSSTQVYKFT